MKKVKVYCGESIQDFCDGQLHPIKEVEKASDVFKFLVGESHFYSNSPDFVSAMKYIGEKQNVEVEFFLDGISCGNDIEPIFKDFNRALDMINELGKTEE